MLKPANLVVPTLLSIVAWSLECLALWVILRGFGETTSVPLCIFFYATSTLAGALVPVPGGLGVTEGALQEQMTALGHVDKGTSTAAMILVRFATLWFAVLVGFRRSRAQAPPPGPARGSGRAEARRRRRRPRHER